MEEPKTDIKIVDLDFDVFTDKKEKCVIFKFSNFENIKQMEEFKEYLIDNLSLILFTSDVKH
jgi:hypothetical protein